MRLDQLPSTGLPMAEIEKKIEGWIQTKLAVSTNSPFPLQTPCMLFFRSHRKSISWSVVGGSGRRRHQSSIVLMEILQCWIQPAFLVVKKGGRGFPWTVQKAVLGIMGPTCTNTMWDSACSKERNGARLSRKDHWIQPIINNGKYFQIKVIGMIQHRSYLCELVLGKIDNSKVKRK